MNNWVKVYVLVFFVVLAFEAESQNTVIVPYQFNHYDLVQRTFSPIIDEQKSWNAQLGHHSNTGAFSSINRSYFVLDKRIAQQSDLNAISLGLSLEVEREGEFFRRNRGGCALSVSRELSKNIQARVGLHIGFYGLTYQGATTQTQASEYVLDLNLGLEIVLKKKNSVSFIINQAPDLVIQPIDENLDLPRVYNLLLKRKVEWSKIELDLGAWIRYYQNQFDSQFFARATISKQAFMSCDYILNKGFVLGAGIDFEWMKKYHSQIFLNYLIQQSQFAGFNKVELGLRFYGKGKN